MDESQKAVLRDVKEVLELHGMSNLLIITDDEENDSTQMFGCLGDSGILHSLSFALKKTLPIMLQQLADSEEEEEEETVD
jgi:hypothetical protein